MDKGVKVRCLHNISSHNEFYLKCHDMNFDCEKIRPELIDVGDYREEDREKKYAIFKELCCNPFYVTWTDFILYRKYLHEVKDNED